VNFMYIVHYCDDGQSAYILCIKDNHVRYCDEVQCAYILCIMIKDNQLTKTFAIEFEFCIRVTLLCICIA